MADPAQVPETGGGEGPLETKTAEAPTQPKPEETKAQEVPVVEKPQQESKEETKPEAPVVEAQPKEVPGELTSDSVKVDEIQPNTQSDELAPQVITPITPVDVAPIPQENQVSEQAAEVPIKVEDAKPAESAPVLEATTVEEVQTNGSDAAAEPSKVEESLPAQSGDWQQREQELLKKIEELEKVKNERSEDGLRLELKLREEEIDLLKARVKNLETELQAALSKPGGKNQEIIDKIKQQHDELLSKAKGMIFDKTKMVKNQELQIEALTTQVASLKDINLITKDLLEIRNSEVKAMEERFQAMESRFKAEKERYDLVLKRAQTSNNINDDLRKEYETQLSIFKELRQKYEQRVQALVAENTRLKESTQGPPGPPGPQGPPGPSA